MVAKGTDRTEWLKPPKVPCIVLCSGDSVVHSPVIWCTRQALRLLQASEQRRPVRRQLYTAAALHSGRQERCLGQIPSSGQAACPAAAVVPAQRTSQHVEVGQGGVGPQLPGLERDEAHGLHYHARQALRRSPLHGPHDHRHSVLRLDRPKAHLPVPCRSRGCAARCRHRKQPEDEHAAHACMRTRARVGLTMPAGAPC